MATARTSFISEAADRDSNHSDCGHNMLLLHRWGDFPTDARDIHDVALIATGKLSNRHTTLIFVLTGRHKADA